MTGGESLGLTSSTSEGGGGGGGRGKEGRLVAPQSLSRLNRAPSTDIEESDDDDDDHFPTSGLASLKPPSLGASGIPRGSDPTPTTPASTFTEESALVSS